MVQDETLCSWVLQLTHDLINSFISDHQNFTFIYDNNLPRTWEASPMDQRFVSKNCNGLQMLWTRSVIIPNEQIVGGFATQIMHFLLGHNRRSLRLCRNLTYVVFAIQHRHCIEHSACRFYSRSSYMETSRKFFEFFLDSYHQNTCRTTLILENTDCFTF